MGLTGNPLNIILPASQHVVASHLSRARHGKRHPNVRMIRQFDGGVDYRSMATRGLLASRGRASLQRQVTRTRLHSQSASTHES